jgi:hypothetical protein
MRKAFNRLLVILLVFSWLLSGWPVVWNNPRIPPKIQEVKAASPETFTSSGTFTPENGIYAVDAECWGGGGAGGGSSSTTFSGGGGGGGAYSKKISIGVTPGTGYTVSVGVGGSCATGAAGSAGGDSWFNTTGTVFAKGGGGGGLGSSAGGAAGIGATATLGDTNYSGGNGFNGVGTTNAKGGGGGGSGGTGSNGNSATSQTAASAVSGGGPGGTGGGNHASGVAPVSGPGGGGGGGGHITGTTNTAGGSGYEGQCVISYTDTWAPSTSQTLYASTWSFANVPINESAVQIGMTAMTGYDYTGPINYLFTLDNTDCGANAGTGGDSSSWQTSTAYSDSGLQPNKCYGYTVTSRDSVGSPNTGTASSISSTYTSANIPGTPTLTSTSTTTLSLTNAENSNSSANPTTYFAVQVVTTSPNDSTWLNKWVDASGNPSSSEAWLTDSALDSLVLQGLTTGTTYGVKVKARNQDNDETALSAEGQGTPSGAISISLTSDGSVSFGYLGVGTSADTTPSGKNDAEVINVDSGPANLQARSTGFTAPGNTWSLGVGSSTDQVKWEFSKDTSSWTTFAVAGNLYSLATNVGAGVTTPLYLRLTMPTSTNSYNEHSVAVTVVASAP